MVIDQSKRVCQEFTNWYRFRMDQMFLTISLITKMQKTTFHKLVGRDWCYEIIFQLVSYLTRLCLEVLHFYLDIQTSVMWYHYIWEMVWIRPNLDRINRKIQLGERQEYTRTMKTILQSREVATYGWTHVWNGSITKERRTIINNNPMWHKPINKLYVNNYCQGLRVSIWRYICWDKLWNVVLTHYVMG